MPSELVITSAVKGLIPGTYGFCAVAASREMNEQTRTALNTISGYRRLSDSDENKNNPVAFSYLLFTMGRSTLRVMSRVCDAGVDYSNRTNKLAHFLVLDEDEIKTLPEGPAALCKTNGLFVESWTDADAPHYLDERKINVVKAKDPSSVANGVWRELTNDAGWAGLLASTVASKRPAILLTDGSIDTLPLFEEALALLPENERWNATFSTFYTLASPNVQCQWKTLIDGAYDVKLLNNRRALIIDLRDPKRLGNADSAALTSEERKWIIAARQGGVRKVEQKKVDDGPVLGLTHEDEDFLYDAGISSRSKYSGADSVFKSLKEEDYVAPSFGEYLEPEEKSVAYSPKKKGFFESNWVYVTIGMLIFAFIVFIALMLVVAFNNGPEHNDETPSTVVSDGTKEPKVNANGEATESEHKKGASQEGAEEQADENVKPESAKLAETESDVDKAKDDTANEEEAEDGAAADEEAKNDAKNDDVGEQTVAEPTNAESYEKGSALFDQKFLENVPEDPVGKFDYYVKRCSKIFGEASVFGEASDRVAKLENLNDFVDSVGKLDECGSDKAYEQWTYVGECEDTWKTKNELIGFVQTSIPEMRKCIDEFENSFNDICDKANAKDDFEKAVEKWNECLGEIDNSSAPVLSKDDAESAKNKFASYAEAMRRQTKELEDKQENASESVEKLTLDDGYFEDSKIKLEEKVWNGFANFLNEDGLSVLSFKSLSNNSYKQIGKVWERKDLQDERGASFAKMLFTQNSQVSIRATLELGDGASIECLAPNPKPSKGGKGEVEFAYPLKTDANEGTFYVCIKEGAEKKPAAVTFALSDNLCNKTFCDRFLKHAKLRWKISNAEDAERKSFRTDSCQLLKLSNKPEEIKKSFDKESVFSEDSLTSLLTMKELPEYACFVSLDSESLENGVPIELDADKNVNFKRVWSVELPDQSSAEIYVTYGAPLFKGDKLSDDLCLSEKWELVDIGGEVPELQSVEGNDLTEKYDSLKKLLEDAFKKTKPESDEDEAQQFVKDVLAEISGGSGTEPVKGKLNFHLAHKSQLDKENEWIRLGSLEYEIPKGLDPHDVKAE